MDVYAIEIQKKIEIRILGFNSDDLQTTYIPVEIATSVMSSRDVQSALARLEPFTKTSTRKNLIPMSSLGM